MRVVRAEVTGYREVSAETMKQLLTGPPERGRRRALFLG